MSYLLKWQSFSFISRVLAMILGLIQSIIIVNVLSPDSWGAVQVAASIASIIGVTQSLGSTSASTREISSAKSKNYAFKVFFSALILRNLISLPFALFLFIAAPFLAKNRIADFNDVVWALRLISITLLVQTSQGIFNSVLSGFHKFKVIFIFQVFIAVISVLLYVPLVYWLNFRGYYIAYFILNALSASILFVLAIKNFNYPYPFVSKKEFILIAREIFSVSLSIYLVKLLYTFWLQGPILFLEYVIIDSSVIPIFAFGLLYATKLLVFSDSITDVTLPVMSKKFTEDIDDFKSTYKNNFAKTILIITTFSTLAAFWNKEIIIFLMKRDYFSSINIIPFVILGIWSYSNSDLIKSSLFVPAKKLKHMIYVFMFMPISVYFIYYLIYPALLNVLVSLVISFGLGSLLAFIFALILVFIDFRLNLISFENLLFLLLSGVMLVVFYLNLSLYSKLMLSVIYCLVVLYFMNRNGTLLLFTKKMFKK